LYGHDILINKAAFDLENNYGVELFRASHFDEAEKHFQRSVELYPRWWFAYNNLGAVYERKGDLGQARKFYEQSIKISDYYLAYENLGFILLKTTKPEGAIVFLKEAILKFPQNSRLRVALALAYYKAENQKEAARYAQEAYFLDPVEQNRILVKMIISGKKIDF
jgi:Flp pilus assembly protein TadD